MSRYHESWTSRARRVSDIARPIKSEAPARSCRQFIDGPVIVGESKAKHSAVAAAISEGYDEAQSDEQVPPKYWESHMHYFGELKKRVQAQSIEEAEPAEEAEPDSE